MSDLTLYGYWRSSAAYRVRIALNLKQLPYIQKSIHLVNNGGEQHSAQFQALNASELVPVLIDGDVRLNQSLAIIDYLDEQYPSYLLTPLDKQKRYIVKALAQDIAVDIHPINNLRVLQYLSKELSVVEEQKSQWYRHWIDVGFHSLEKKLAQTHGAYCVGDDISLVDVCLVPQVYNAERFSVDLSRYPLIHKVTMSLREHPAFISAAPEHQPDAVTS
ncbi:maleylacetoacetate isomerase [Vibrio sp. Isolate25]|uniref:maleylacetoacetate isomerase n=1 Tax=Vibrio TaxID=662 RepID=UPI001EFD4D81|nr:MULTISPECIES: maleylacetoacetate isomerase [Vibrio]MCG9597304.1 maleylacetoacetate isomerase [Vibrio sp. Isolate25]USD33809.1 maleylacetoacetate isomerase [Vibrio sp. SCSIO 43186]USD46909.1 maleylacetoacetate isomerase [Vibrio sp. SCSIO 43145]USD70933.1 maleylacetoacetate isomerase [Vibrio sp. SCSIO 43139]USD95839.1 maleylacetoacetate isomerase [Vibrio coralliilyticus]